MAEKKKTSSKKSTKQVMDVSKPGKTTPSASSRPVIVGHGLPVKDPMVSEDNKMPDTEPEEHKIEVKRSGPKVIAPLSSAEALAKAKESEAEAADAEELDTAAEPAVETPDTEVTPVDNSEETVDEPVEETETEDLAETSEESAEETPADDTSDSGKESKDKKDKGSSIVDAVAGQAAKSKDKKDDKKNEELKKRLAAVEKLVDDKKYFVKTSSTTKKERKTRWAILILAMLLLVGAYLILDAQLIKNDYWLPYHFFKEDKKDTTSDLPAANTSEQPSNNQTQKDEAIKVPDGWSQNEAKSMFLSFALPKGWTFIDHAENACSKGRYLEINAPANAIAPVASAMGAPNLKKYRITVDTTYDGVPENCGGLSSGVDYENSFSWHSSDELKTGLFKKTWLTWGGSAEDKSKVDSATLTAKSYDTDNGALGEDPILEADGKKWVVHVFLDSGAFTQSRDPQPVPLEKFKDTDLYKDTIEILNTFEYAKNAL